MIKRLLILVLTISTYVCYSQDIHTTQLNEHDYLYNPGLVGNYHGNSRVQFSTRSQWSSINNAYQTYSFSTDYKLGINKWDKGNLGIGIAANSDKSGNNFLSNNTVNLGVSGLILLSDIYLAKDDPFQAKATLESIIENYEGDDKIKNEAQHKLDALIQENKPPEPEQEEEMEIDMNDIDDLDYELLYEEEQPVDEPKAEQE